MTSIVRKTLLWVSLGLWGLSLALPVTLNNDLPWFGFHVLALGWMGVVLLQFAWFANLLFLVAALLLGIDAKSRSAAILLTIPILLLTVEAMLPGMTPADLAGINWGNGPRDTSLVNGPGYYLWLLVMLGMPAALIANAFVPRQVVAPPAPVLP